MTMVSSLRFALLAFTILSLQHTPTFASKKSYIVYLGAHSHGMNPTELDANIATQKHYDILKSALGSYEMAQESMQYSYNKYINGFAAELTEDQVERIRKSSNVISIFENRRLKLSTTHSWEFLGLEQNGIAPSDSLWNMSNYGDGIIIGNIDSGVWPESKSFDDKDLGPIPSRWKGECVTGSDPSFKCNKKLIGARYFVSEKVSNHSPRDTDGHGTHTLSTAGGSFVKGASVFDYGYGVAKGGAPYARVATYKACAGSCSTSDTMAAFEAAIGDGVDVLSVSINHNEEIDYKDDGVAIASFHAVQHGIVVVNSAGNNGPESKSVTSIAPWMLTVGAGTIDREFYNEVYLGNSTLHFKGAYFGPDKMRPVGQFYPLIVSTSAVASSSTVDKARFCEEDSLDSSKVKGKIVICEYPGISPLTNGKVVKEAGGVGMIVVNGELIGPNIYAEPHFLPASHLSYNDGQTVLNYVNKTMNPTAYIADVKTVLGIKPAPMVADFSSRGPSVLYPQILKPDVIAPGMDIIAAYTEAKGFAPGLIKHDTRRASFWFMDGTSMSCPHVAGVVGLLKSLHPDWSPAAFRSALMTTATTFDNSNGTIMDYDKQRATPFAIGAGHINPNAAVNPGLIYNLTDNDYLNFLCSLGSYTEKDIQAFSPNPYKCPVSKSILDFNYPSISVTNFTSTTNLTRTVTNVGKSGTYEAKVTTPFGVNVTVIPSKLSFNHTGEEHTFSVELKAIGEKPQKPEYVFGSLVWSDGTHNVRSPIVVERV